MRYLKRIFIGVLIFLIILSSNNVILVVKALSEALNIDINTISDGEEYNQLEQIELEDITSSITVTLTDLEGNDLSTKENVSRNSDLICNLEFNIGNDTFWDDVENLIFTYNLNSEYINYLIADGYMKDNNDTNVARWSIENGLLKIEFIDDSWFIINSNRKGNIKVSGKFNYNKLKDKESVQLEFPGESNVIEINFGEGDINVNKTVYEVTDEKGYDCLRYQIIIENEGTDKTINLEDYFHGKKENVLWDSLKVTKNYFEITDEIEIKKIEEDSNLFTSSFIVKAGENYQITYLVKLDEADFENDEKCYNSKNTLKYSVDDKEKEEITVEQIIPKRPLLDKRGVFENENGIYTFKWTIDINKPKLQGYTVKNKILYDDLSVINLPFEHNYVGELKLTGNNGYEKSFEINSLIDDKDDKGFTLDFSKVPTDDGNGHTFDPNDSFTITYCTQAIATGVYEGKINNVVNFDNEEDEYAVRIVGQTNIGFDKKYVNVDYSEKTLEWEINVSNINGQTLSDVEIEDVMYVKDDYHVLPETIKIKNSKGYLQEGTDYTVELNDSWSYSVRIKFVNPITEDFTITLKSRYDKIELYDQHFTNTANLDYTLDNIKYEKTAKAECDINKKNLIDKKYSTFEGNSKIVNWTINVNNYNGLGYENYLQSEIEDVYVKDVLPEKTKFIENSLHIRKKGPGYSWEEGYLDVDITEDVDVIVNDREILFKNLGKNANVDYVGSGTNNYVYEITYQTSFDNDFLYDNNNQYKDIIEATNTAYLMNKDDVIYNEDSATVLDEIQILDKSCVGANFNDSYLHYTVYVNSAGFNLLLDSDYLDLDDTIPESLNLILSSVSVKDIDGQELENATISYDKETRVLSVHVPDETPCCITYEADINGDVGQTYDIENEICFRQKQNISSSVSGNYRKYAKSSSITGNPGRFSVQKLDSKNLKKKLENATFQLYEITYTNDKEDIDIDNPKLIDTYDTNKEGVVILPSGSRETLQADNLYYYVEAKAPEGYILDETKYYVILEGDDIEKIKEIMKTKHPEIKYEIMPKESTVSFNVANKPEVTKLKLKTITKKLNGNSINGRHFTFELKDEYGKVLETVQSDDEGHANFKELEYDIYDVGNTYKYTIIEKPSNNPKISDDQTAYEVEVTVNQNDNKKLSFNTVYKNLGETVQDVVFTNNWIASGSTDITINKKLIGNRNKNIDDGEFNFEVVELNPIEDDPNFKNYTEKENKQIVSIVQSSTKDSNGTYSANANLHLSLIDSGTYWYKIREQSISDNNIEIDNSVFYAKVTVENEGTLENNVYKLNTSVTYYNSSGNPVNNIEFTNAYKATGSTQIEVEKKLVGRTLKLKEDEFQFALYKIVDGVETPVTNTDGTNLIVKNKLDGKITFNLNYNQDDIGKHSYVIKELDHNSKSVSKDEEPINFTVTVTDKNGTGNLSCVVKLQGEHTYFTNIYTAKGKITLNGLKKVLRNRLKSIAENEFSFEVLDEDNKVVSTGKTQAGGNIAFTEINYTEKDFGEHVYKIREIQGEDESITCDSREIEVLVNVVDNNDGTMTITPTYPEGGIVFENYYNASGSIEINAKKEYKDKQLQKDDFSFELKDEDGNVLETVTNDENGLITFSPRQYTQDDIGKVFKYTVEEVNDGKTGIIYDTQIYYVEISVEDSDSSNGELKISKKIQKKVDSNIENPENEDLKPEENDGENPDKNNTSDENSNQEILDEEKMDDKDLQKDKENSTDDSLNNKENSTKDSSNNKESTTEDSSNNKENSTENSSNNEENPSEESSNNKGDMNSEDSQHNNDTNTENFKYEDVEEILFNNEYAPKANLQLLTGTKVLLGNRLKPIQESEFTFTITDETGKVVSTGTTKEDGTIEFTQIQFEKKDIGEHIYTISEDKGQDSTITYDEKNIEIPVKIVDNQDGTLGVETEYPKEGIIFENKYNASGNIQLIAQKQYKDKQLQKDDFKFELKDEAGNVIQTATNDENGVIKFSEINYTQEDIGKVFNYTIEEKDEGKVGIIYDDSIYSIEILVEDSDESNGELKITKTVKKNDLYHENIKSNIDENNDTFSNDIDSVQEEKVEIIFENEYDPHGKLLLSGTKKLTGNRLKAIEENEFTFTVKDENGNVVSTGATKKDGSIEFTEIEYSKLDIGDHVYTISENVGKDGTIIYDKKEIKIPIKVIDKQNGTLETEAEYPKEGIIFENKYNAPIKEMPEVEKHEEEKKKEVEQRDIEDHIVKEVIEEKQPENIELDVFPKTSDNIIFMFMLLGTSLIISCLAVIFKKKNN